MPRRSHSPSRSRSRSPPPELPGGAAPISESDYFLKSAEFRVWLKDEKGKFFDELKSDKARSYFRKFVKAWNRGKLSRTLYAGVDDAATTNTSYKWSFAEKTSKADRNALAAARDEIHSATRAGGAGPGPSASSSAPRRTLGPTIGPTLPSASDLTLAREDAAEDAATERARARKRQRADERDRVEDMVGPKPVGREGAVEAKRARREADAAFRAGRDDGGAPEADERTLLGGGDDFRAAIARRDAARKRTEDKRGTGMASRDAERSARAEVHRAKEKSTMDMLQQLAASRFGS